MRTFSSYGPIDKDIHYHVPREELIDSAHKRLIGEKPGKGGHYITVWAPRQAGKTWIMHQVVKKIREQGDFEVAIISMQSAKTVKTDKAVLKLFTNEMGDCIQPVKMVTRNEGLLKLFIERIGGWFDKTLPEIDEWENLADLFTNQWLEKPLILIIDEFDAIRNDFINNFANEFRNMHIRRQSDADNPPSKKRCFLHGLALIGVRSVLGIEDESGSPFNVQRSVRIPNLTRAEVSAMFQWYVKESGQKIETAVVDKIYHVTSGQPGLVSWFGELLTEIYNPGPDKTIGMDAWRLVWLKARKKEPNNTVMNMVAKARNDRYRPFLLKLFTQPDIPFSFDNPIHNYLHLHGILDSKTGVLSTGEEDEICCFSSPFIQRRLYEALGHDMVGDGTPILSLDPLDELTDVFEGPSLDLPALLRRYKKYLVRLKDKGIDPWLDQPRRKTDLHLTEAVGHFHLYAWLRTAVGGLCVISPEFPTGNGKVDIHLRCADKQGIIEVKSFVSAHQVKTDREKAAWYAKSLGLDTVTLAIFVAVGDDAVLEKLSGEEMIDGVQVVVTAIGRA